MSEEELKDLDKEVRRLKRIAGEWAAQMHDLVEERLPASYEEIPALAQATYDACRAWAEANTRLTTLQKG
ncbi:hypothetical protein ARNL5_02397 [Anaerolineae bacterium]|nr:hypothetical protein ARNL5_02397 [Anaerolineae bacterium]